MDVEESIPLLSGEESVESLHTDANSASVRTGSNTIGRLTLEPDITIENECLVAGTSRSGQGLAPEDSDVEVNIQKLLLQTKENRDLLNSAYALPDGKDAHFFVSYSSEDKARVLPIVYKLETKHNVACIFDERDFTHGLDIALNITRSMERSMKVLFFLSKNFLNSNYCSHEQNLAFVMQMESGESKIIPVMLEKCRLPSTLKTLTYIDVSSEDVDVSSEAVDVSIMSAYSRTDTDILPADFDFVAPKKLENGYSYDVGCVVEKTWIYCQPAVRHLTFDDSTLQALLDAKLKVSDETLFKVSAIVNSGYSTSLWSRLDPCVLACLGICSFPFLLLVLWCLQAVLYLSVYDRSRETSDERNLSINVTLFLILLCGPPVFFICLCFTSKVCKIKGLAKLQTRLHTEVTRYTYKTGVLFDIYKQPARFLKCVRENIVIYVLFLILVKLRIIRYDTRPCHKYLTNKIAEKLEEESDLSIGIEMLKPEDVAEGMILRQLRKLGINLTVLPDAPVNRHNVKGGKACFCQMLEGAILTELFRIKQPRIGREEEMGKCLV